MDARMEIWSVGDTAALAQALATGDASMDPGTVDGEFAGAAATLLTLAAGTYRYELWGHDTNTGTLRPLWRGRIIVQASIMGELP
jgi:hypothetical protein